MEEWDDDGSMVDKSDSLSGMQNALTDAEIVQAVLAGNSDSFETLVERYEARVFRIAGNHVPEDAIRDVAQETFISAFIALPEFRGDAPFEHWISKLTIRRCYDYWRKQKRRREVLQTTLERNHEKVFEDILAGQAVEVFQREQSRVDAKRILQWALSSLGAEDRIVLALTYLQDHTISEAANLLGWSIANVKVRNFRARKKLHAKITKQFLKERKDEKQVG